MSILLAVVLGLAVALAYVSLSSKGEGPKPPGPRPLPVLGNLFDMPREREWLTFREWGRKWGDIVSISIFGNTIIVLNTIKEAVEMLDGKGAVYSDRPHIPMIELMGWDNSVGLGPYGTESYRETKRLFHQLLGTHASLTQFHSVEQHEVQKFASRLLVSPEKFSEHIKTTTASIILRIAYGYVVQESDDPFVRTCDEAMNQVSEAASPGNFLVNIVPALNQLPEWVPGTGFKRQARLWAQTLNEMIGKPYSFVKAQVDTGKAEPSVTSRLLEGYAEAEIDAKTEFYIQWVGGTMIAGGTATIDTTLHVFMLAMLLHPDAQRKAQAELDTVIGSGRLPICADRDSLPYVHALVLELMRWHTVVPSGVAHSSTEDTVYKGYFIPKGSIIIPNTWNMAHDPAIYHDPMTFKPERFLTAPGYDAEPDPRSTVYGFGRRICAGRLLADMTVFLACSTVLAVFDISPHLDNGVPVLPVVDQLPGTISNPPPFKCTIKPRTKAAVSLINGTTI